MNHTAAKHRYCVDLDSPNTHLIIETTQKARRQDWCGLNIITILNKQAWRVFNSPYRRIGLKLDIRVKFGSVQQFRICLQRIPRKIKEGYAISPGVRTYRNSWYHILPRIVCGKKYQLVCVWFRYIMIQGKDVKNLVALKLIDLLQCPFLLSYRT